MFCLLDDKLQIGFLTQQKCKSLLEEGDVSEQDITKFYLGVRAFFKTATAYSLQNLPHKDDVLKNAGFVMFENRMSADQLLADLFVSRYIAFTVILYSILCIHADIVIFYPFHLHWNKLDLEKILFCTSYLARRTSLRKYGMLLACGAMRRMKKVMRLRGSIG